MGAGASLSKPACLPLFSQLRKALFNGLRIEKTQLLQHVAPESLLYYLNVSNMRLFQF